MKLVGNNEELELQSRIIHCKLQVGGGGGVCELAEWFDVFSKKRTSNSWLNSFLKQITSKWYTSGTYKWLSSAPCSCTHVKESYTSVSIVTTDSLFLLLQIYEGCWQVLKIFVRTIRRARFVLVHISLVVIACGVLVTCCSVVTHTRNLTF